MMDRVTALLTQAAATILVVIGLVAILGFTHSRAYRAGYCAVQTCADSGEQRWWWPFGRETPPAPDGPARITPDYTPDNFYSYRDSPYQDTPYQDRPYQDRPAGEPGSDTGYPGSVVYGDPAGTASTLPLSFGTGPVTTDYPRTYVAPRYGSRSRFFGTPGERICPAPFNSEDARRMAPELARCWLNIGDAYQAMDQMEQARDAWNRSLHAGSQSGVQATLAAQQRLQTAVLQYSCPSDADSLARIAYGAGQPDSTGDIIQLIARQRALAALGFYSGPVDGSYGPVTRRSVRDFQREMGYDQTGALTSQETVTLICHAAINARDADSQNLMGIMFATGLGVIQSIDSAMEWLDTAAERGNGGANFNLALIYGTGTVQGSYRLCGLIESPERADSYLRRAADLGHARAIRLRREFASTSGTPAERWTRISQALLREAEASGDRFYLAWQQRVDEARRENGHELNQPGCYQATLDDGQPVAARARQTD
ncbi:peptidoglycan-binding protein [Maricaulis sp.]|uniref:peptidoglycan-binding protein n=1 Tax=Maricaulis sp. TaxID=1486257 RepID=UPI003A956DDC